MTAAEGRASDEQAAAVGLARRIIGGLVLGVLAAALPAGLLDLSIGYAALTAPSALLGLVGPVTGYRLHQRLVAGLSSSPEWPRARYLRAISLPLAITASVALLGIVSFALGGGPFSLVGVWTHILLAAALWPSADRLSSWRDGSA